MDRQEAYQTLVQNYLARRNVSADKRENLGKVILDELQSDSDLITGLREHLQDTKIAKNQRVAYLDAQTLFLIQAKIDQVPDGQLKARDCKFKITRKEFKDLENEYRVFISEIIAERGMYGGW